MMQKHFKKTNSLSSIPRNNVPIWRRSVEGVPVPIMAKNEDTAGDKKALEYASKTVNGIAGSVASQLNHIMKYKSQSDPSFQEMAYHVTNDPKLWKEFRREVTESKVVTNIGATEVLEKFIIERRKDITLGCKGDAKMAGIKKTLSRRNIGQKNDVAVRATNSSSTLSSISAADSSIKRGIQKTASMSMILTRSLSSKGNICSSSTQHFSEITPKTLIENSSQPNDGWGVNSTQPSSAQKICSNAVKMNSLKKTATFVPSLANMVCSEEDEDYTDHGLDLLVTWARRSLVETQEKARKSIEVEKKDPSGLSGLSSKTSVLASKASFGKGKQKRSFYDSQFHLRYDQSDELHNLHDSFKTYFELRRSKTPAELLVVYSG